MKAIRRARKPQALSQRKTFWATFKKCKLLSSDETVKTDCNFFPWFFQVLLENPSWSWWERDLYCLRLCLCAMKLSELSWEIQSSKNNYCYLLLFFECWQLVQRKMSSSLRKLGDYRCDFAHQVLTGDWVGGRELCNWCLWQMNLCYRRDLKEEELVCCF